VRVSDGPTITPPAEATSLWRVLTRTKPALVGVVLLLSLMSACVLSLPWTLGSVGSGSTPRYAYQDRSATRMPPSWAPLSASAQQQLERSNASRPSAMLGTDPLGRDVLARCLLGGAISLGIGIAAATLSVFLGTLYGALAGYLGGRTDNVMMRIVDILYGLPYILLVVLLAVAVDGLIDRWQSARTTELNATQLQLVNLCTLLVAIGGVSWLTMARVVRGQVLALKQQPFMEAARAIGVPVHRQLIVHLLPNLIGPIIVYATLTVPQAILQESFLSFLGIGVKPPVPSWGNLAAEGLEQLNVVQSQWWLLLFPCVLLALTLLALNFVGESLRQALDPKHARSRA
jgi:ABC-type dipeptide/oligopeptide/nickel transport system permease subunit